MFSGLRTNIVGIFNSSSDAAKANERSLDLVEVGASADPPVCRILDWGKVKFDREKKARESRRKASVVELKEVKMRIKIDSHD